ncbi:MAG: alpha/beta hydrolase [Candidatus Glassbacteria bacterium]|nr:alpha/beta hydrolase [Candidatus Glassbacteria bacterium]
MGVLKSLWVGSVSMLVVLLVVALLIRLLENRLTFFPSAVLEAHPDSYGLSYREMLLEPAGGGTVHGWYFPPARADAPVLVVFHGNAGNISHRLDWIAPFVRRGLGALLFDYRGYGLSQGRPSEKSLQEDALAVWDYLTGSAALPARRLVLFGRSLGSAPACYLAVQRQVGGLILEGAFCRGSEMARRIFGFLPVHLVMKNRWEVAGMLSGVRVPTLIIHGTADEVVPFEFGKRLAQTKGPPRLEWWQVSGGGHLDLHFLLGESYYGRVERFAGEAVPGPAGL